MDLDASRYPVTAVASMLKVSRAVCLRLIKTGDLDAERTPRGLRVSREALFGWIDRQIALAAAEGHGLAKEDQKK
jgi:excisionase family DNA binding protein